MRHPLKTFAAASLAGLLLAGCANDPIVQDAMSDVSQSVTEPFGFDNPIASLDDRIETSGLTENLAGAARGDITGIDLAHMERSAAYVLDTKNPRDVHAWQSSRTGHQGWTRADGSPRADCRTLWVSFQNKAGETARGRTRACRLADGSWRLGGVDIGPYPEPAETEREWMQY